MPLAVWVDVVARRGGERADLHDDVGALEDRLAVVDDLAAGLAVVGVRPVGSSAGTGLDADLVAVLDQVLGLRRDECDPVSSGAVSVGTPISMGRAG